MAKGLDIPEVTLVGVVSADVALNLPDERAAERTYQLLAQAVGRAGRGDRPGRAIIQSYQPDHPAIQAVVGGDANAFYDAELEVRRRFGSPPFGRLVKLTVGLEDAAAAERDGVRRWPTGCERWPPSGAPRSRSSARLRRSSGAGPAAGAGTSSCAVSDRPTCSTAVWTRPGRSTSTPSRSSDGSWCGPGSSGPLTRPG